MYQMNRKGAGGGGGEGNGGAAGAGDGDGDAQFTDVLLDARAAEPVQARRHDFDFLQRPPAHRASRVRADVPELQRRRHRSNVINRRDRDE